jgi:hypothetical protein
MHSIMLDNTRTSGSTSDICGRRFLSGNLKYFLIICLMLAVTNLKAQIQFDLNSGYKYLKGSVADTLPSDWMSNDYNDSGWDSGTAPFRYGDGTGGTLLSDMEGNYSTVYLRSTFNAFTINRIKTITFSVNFDDGFVIWINGVRVLSNNAPETLTNTSFATAYTESGTPVAFDVDSSQFKLVEGENVVCVQGLNGSLASTDFYFDMSINASLSYPDVPDSLTLDFDHDAGFYDSAFNLEIKTGAEGYHIVYTLDGSNPQTSATAITAGKLVSVTVDPESTVNRAKTPVFIVRASLAKEGYTPSKPVAKSYIFLDEVLTQTYPGGGWPSSSVNGQSIDLEMDPDVVNDSRYSSSMKTSLLAVPSVSVVTDNANLFDPSTGIYVNAYSHGEEWERECSVELINPDSSPGFQVDAGLRIRGGASRAYDNPKHAFRLFFRKEYGPGKLKYSLFGDEGASEFDKVDLRTEQNYSWSFEGDSHNTFLRDIFSRDLQRDLGQPYTRGRYCHLYLNGMYWGLYQTEERSEESYASTYFGDNEEDYDVIKVTTEYYINEVTNGTIDKWKEVWDRCTTGFASNASYFSLEGKDEYGKPAKNTRVLVDIDNLIDYMLTIFYTGNVDAPVSAFFSNSRPNNYYAILNRKNKGKGFIFIAHDSEHTMFVDSIYRIDGINENRVTIDDPAMSATGEYDFQPQWLHDKLTRNSEYCLRFADRAFAKFEEGGALSYEECVKRFNVRKQEVDMPIIAESARWGDAKYWVPRNKFDDWLPEVNRILNDYFPYRAAIVIAQLKAAGLYYELEPVVIKKDGVVATGNNILSGSANITFQNPNSGGTILYTTDGTDPRVIGGTVAPSAVVAANNSSMNISRSTLIKARISTGDSWSVLKEVSFSAANEDYSGLKVTEVNYNPADYITATDTLLSKNLEFLELKNCGTSAINISGVVIDSAVHYTVPEGIILPPKAFYVVASKPECFYDRYGMNPSGNFQGNLSNGGEYILITDRNGNKILSFTYSDNSPWPLNADGGGKSLVAASFMPYTDPDDYQYWRSSVNDGGSPFADDGATTAVTPVTDDQQDAIVIYPNPASEMVYISLADHPSEIIKIRITTLDGRTILVRDIENNTGINLKESGIKAGVYVVTAKCGNLTRSIMLVYSPTN